jgi:hypothetical protein
MQFVILRLLKHNELGVFHSYRRLGKERAKQRAINFDGEVVDRVFPAAKDVDKIDLMLLYETDTGVAMKTQWIKKQARNWRLEGNCPEDYRYDFVDPGCLFAMVVDAGQDPGIGAWAVFSAEDPVTKAILANSESAELTNKSMIALHDEEGERTRALLLAAKPGVFGRGAKEMPTATTYAPDTDLAPNPKRLVRICLLYTSPSPRDH